MEYNKCQKDIIYYILDKNVSSFVLNILQQKAEEINKENPDLREIKEITLPSGTYELQEDGSYKKIK